MNGYTGDSEDKKDWFLRMILECKNEACSRAGALEGKQRKNDLEEAYEGFMDTLFSLTAWMSYSKNYTGHELYDYNSLMGLNQEIFNMRGTYSREKHERALEIMDELLFE